MSLLSLKDISFSFPGKELFKNLDLSVTKGDITVIMGPSGCGKSSLLSLIGGRLVPSSGTIKFNNGYIEPNNKQSLYAHRRQMGMLFQSSALLTDLSVFENVAFPIREHTDLCEDIIRLIVLIKLEMVGLRGTTDLMPSELSGGMARRVALARTIALDPALVMYDEPFTGLDPISMGVIVKLIRQLNDALGLTSIVVTHDVAEGCSIADYIYIVGNGNLIGQGTVEQLQHSDDPLVRQFMSGLPDGPVAYHYPAEPFSAALTRS